MNADTALDTLCEQHDLDTPFPPEVRAEADRIRRDPGFDDPGLEDLDRLPFVTIDEETSRDLDQALCVEADGDGFVAWYAIADAAYFVTPTSALFVEALRRGASAYLPGRVIPMLPVSLSEDLVSLNPSVVRRALVWRMTIDGDGTCAGTTLHRARIRSRAKLSYDGVQAWLDGDAPDPSPDLGVLASLRTLPVFGRLRMGNADERGVVHYRRRELSVEIGGHVASRFVAFGEDRNDVERFNEQLSLLCNIEGARLLRAADRPGDALQPIYRVHEPPSAERLSKLEAQIAAIARSHGLDAARWTWRRAAGVPLSAFLDDLPADGPHDRVARAIHRAAILSNRRSVYRAAPGPHHGVGADVYGRFSAPMREVVGVFLHQELQDLHGLRDTDQPDAEALRTEVIAAATRSRERQRQLDREVNRLALDHLFAAASEPIPATVMGIDGGRLHVQLDDPPIDAKIYLRHLRQRHGELSADAHDTAICKPDGTALATVGGGVRVAVIGSDGDSDRWVLDLV